MRTTHKPKWKADMDKYREQLAAYSDEEVKEMNRKISDFLTESGYTELKEAVAYFYLRLHVMENDHCEGEWVNIN